MPTFNSKYSHKKSARHATDPVRVANVIREYGSSERQCAKVGGEKREVRCGTRVRSVLSWRLVVDSGNMNEQFVQCPRKLRM